MEFHKDEVKNKVVWTKGADFTDGSPRYTFEGRDPATTYERFQVVIYTERERRYAHDPGSLCNHYYGYVRDDKMECAETIGPYYSVRLVQSEGQYPELYWGSSAQFHFPLHPQNALFFQMSLPEKPHDKNHKDQPAPGTSQDDRFSHNKVDAAAPFEPDLPEP